MTPLEWTRGRLLFAAVSLFVYLSGELLKWQEPAAAAGELIVRLTAGMRKLPQQQTPASRNR